MSDNQKKPLESSKKQDDVESDTDNELNSEDSKVSKKINNSSNFPNKINNQSNNLVFNQSKQNFAKFSQMAKHTNNISYSEENLSKVEEPEHLESENSNDYKNSKIFERKDITKEMTKKSETIGMERDYIKTRKTKNSDSHINEEIDEDEYFTYKNNILENFTDKKEAQPLTFFNVDDFLELTLDNDGKSLINIMKEFQPNKNFLILDTKLKPFIPNYLASIGEVDAFLKINRPDNIVEELGLNWVDEPIINGVDPTIFSLELSYKFKTKIPENYVIKSIENADKNPKIIQNWIENLENLHKETSNNFLNYSNKMPEIESLMQVWPEKLENVLEGFIIPKEGINISTDNFAKIICSMLDIPIHNVNSQNDKAIIEAIHVLFSLYSEFKANKHFQVEEKVKNQNVMKFH